MTGSDDRGLGKVLGLGLAVAALLGVAAAGGSLDPGHEQHRDGAQAFPYAMMGALAGVTLVGIAALAHPPGRDRWRCGFAGSSGSPWCSSPRCWAP